MRHSSSFIFLSIVAVSVGLTGCANIGPLGSFALPKNEPAVENKAVGQCTVEFQRGRKTESQTLPVTAETRVQTVLEQTKAYSKFGRMEVMVVRPANKKPQQVVKLVANIDLKKKQVSWDTDYAVLPGDRVIIKKDDSTILDRTLASVLPTVAK